MRFRGNYLGGQFTRPRKAYQAVSEDPGDVARPVGEWWFDRESVDEAVAAAQRAGARWRALPYRQREAAVSRYRQSLVTRGEELARLISREMGKPLWESRQEVQAMVNKVDITRGEGLRFIAPFEVTVDKGVKGRCEFFPRGVLAILGPFNVPGHLINGHLVPALLTGNTVVVKPSEYTPFVGQWIAQAVHAARFPAGVFNLVQGDGRIGRRLALHPGVNGVLFTGSWAAGSRIQQEAQAQPGKLIVLEMGGKNAAIVLDDADLPRAAYEVLVGAFQTTGQRCNSTSRVIVQRRVLEPWLERFLPLLDQARIGYAFEPEVFMGPLVSKAAVRKYLQAMEQAGDADVETLRVGSVLERRPGGYYVTPSAHLKERVPSPLPPHPFTHEEIFGPNVTIYAVDAIDEAVALNNAVPYGLAASVFTKSRKRFETIAPRLEDGVINWNRSTTQSSSRLPFGGVKRSGNDRPAGLFSPLYCTYPVAVFEDRRPLRELPVYPGLPKPEK